GFFESLDKAGTIIFAICFRSRHGVCEWFSDYRFRRIRAHGLRRIRDLIVILSAQRCCESVADKKSDAGCAKRPGNWLLLEMLAPVEGVLYAFVLLGHVAFNFRDSVADGIARLVHSALQRRCGVVLALGFARACQT